MQASDGNLYGMTSGGGTNNGGGLFQFNPFTHTYSDLLAFGGAINGFNPVFTNLIELAATTTTGVNAFSTNNYISLSPNPATNQLTIHTSSFHNEAVTVSIMNVLGQEASPPFNLTLNPSPGGEGSASIDVSKLHAGMYFLQIKTASGSFTKKFVKE